MRRMMVAGLPCIIRFGVNKEVAELLIAKGANVNTKCQSDETPLDLTIESEELEIDDLLRKHGGKTSYELKAKVIWDRLEN